MSEFEKFKKSIEKGNALYRAGKHQEASKCYEEAIFSFNGDAYYRAYIELNPLYQELLDSMEISIKELVNNYKIHMGMTFDEVLNILGEPYETKKDSYNGMVRTEWCYKPGEKNKLHYKIIFFNDKNKVYSMSKYGTSPFGYAEIA